MDRRRKSSKRSVELASSPLAQMRFWSRFRNPPPTLAMTFEEPTEVVSSSLDRLFRGPEQHTSDRHGFILKVALDGCQPTVWRRIQVGDVTLDTLHQIIQRAMGWNDTHLHCFEVRGIPVPLVEDGASITEGTICLAQLYSSRVTRFKYVYDFGDDWRHTVAIESTFVTQITNAAPQCLNGKGGCPPDDVGGVAIWCQLLNSFRDPAVPLDEELQRLRERLGANYTAPTFNLHDVNDRLQRLFKDIRFSR